MNWVKRGRIFEVKRQFPWMSHHAAMPVPALIDDARLRIYFAPRDEEGRSRPAFIEVDPGDPANVLYLHDRPVLDLGKLGSFDDDGIMPSCLVEVGEEKYLFYTGWNRGVSVPYRNAIGYARSTDGGISFERVHEGPLVDRSPTEPYYTGTPFVLRESGTWRMWYMSTTSWIVVHGKPEPVYVIKYAESVDGIEWRRENPTCIPARSPTEAIARPWIVREGDSYRMWYCHRETVDFRTDPRTSYRIGYAESGDGVSWERKDDEAGIDVSDDGWDSQMIEYPAVYSHGGTMHLLYNGNGFGEAGIGHAVLEAG